MSMRAPHNVAIAIVFALLGGVTLLTMAPFELGTIRLAGVSLLWWYGIVVVPAIGVGAAVFALLRAPASTIPAAAPAPASDAE